jgi:predicted transcriptional regulator
MYDDDMSCEPDHCTQLARAEKREQLRLDTLASWDHYQVTGLHLTEQDLDEWMARLEAGEDAPFPKCHV